MSSPFRIDCVVPDSTQGRLDRVLTDLLLQEIREEEGPLQGLELLPTRTKVAAWIEAGLVKLNGRVESKASTQIRGGDSLELLIPKPEAIELTADPLVTLDIVYEDEHLLVLNKASGLVVHPGAGQREGTLVQGLLAHLGEDLRQVGDALRPGIVHRLDKDTSGLMVIAKSDIALQGLSQQFLPPRSISREYLALSVRLPGRGAFGYITAPIARHPKDRKKMAVVAGGKPAETYWELVEALGFGFLLRLKLSTGRTHQIRVHLAHQNAGIIGDPLYGPAVSSLPKNFQAAVAKLGRQALHAAHLEFVHPITQEQLSFSSEVPSDIALLLAVLRNT